MRARARARAKVVGVSARVRMVRISAKRMGFSARTSVKLRVSVRVG